LPHTAQYSTTLLLLLGWVCLHVCNILFHEAFDTRIAFLNEAWTPCLAK